MKIRIVDRILIFAAGLLMIAGCAAFVAQVFFQVDVIGYAAGILSRQSVLAKIVFALTALILLALGIYCAAMLFRRPGRNDQYVIQKTENGELEISLNTMENLIRKCLEQHPEINSDTVTLDNERDGLEIRIKGSVAGGVSIPLTVDTLQKQIKQYVTACSGVEVKNIRVQIEATGEEIKGAPFAIEPPAGIALLRDGDGEKQEEIPEKPDSEAPPVPDIPADLTDSGIQAEKAEDGESAEEPTVSPVHSIRDSGTEVDEPEEGDERPIHQRLFSTKNEPCIVPVPPELENQGSTPEAETVSGTEDKPAGEGETEKEQKHED